MRYADVAVDAPVGYGRTFSYSVPDSLSLSPGHVVRVPFGPRTAQGVVISLTPVAQVADTREIIGTTLPDPILEAHQLDLARWISDYYMCPLFEAAALMLPPGERVRARSYISVGPGADAAEELSLTPFQRRALDYIRRRGSVEQGRLIRAFGEAARGVLGRLAERGIIVRSEGRGRPALGPKYVAYAGVTPEGREALNRGLQEGRRRAPRQAALLGRLSTDASPLTLADARREYGSSAVAALLAKAWIEQTEVVVERDPLRGKAFPPSPPVTLTPRQSAVASEIRAALDDRDPGGESFLIQGVTGSGKTEVYLDAVAHCMELERTAIVLVPEIALTHQTVEAFASRFPGKVAVLHSGLSSGERYDQWWKIKRGEYGVVIGSRSAVFAPQPDLGLIVIDEEHEWTYKQADSSPRYHAREVAERLASVIPAVVVLGSASPDLASYNRANRGELRLLTLPDRVRVDGGKPTESAQLAAVEVVDMRRELREGNREIFSRVLQSDMKECLDAGRQMVLFLNRRGSASHMQCRNCGLSLRCRRCEIALAYHRELDRLLCHYCGYKRIAPAKCSRCLSYRLGYYGVGTETVVEEVAQLFPGVETIRWDRDAARSQKAYESLFNRFKSGKARVLVGTQMIAKGLHFPSVSLVGVVSADIGLNLPDYRASERVFQLLCQVAGRSGRGPWPGKVVIQTYQPDSYAIRAAASQDYPRFYAEEIAFRGEQSNPPFGRLIRLLFSHTNRAHCEQEAQRMSREIRDEREDWALSDVEVLGPTPAYPARLRGHYRWQLVLRGPDPRALLDKVAVPTGWVVDVDPVSLA
jgi:primosomal protein N' (replication factor Y)